jgi:hypothetical protein
MSMIRIGRSLILALALASLASCSRAPEPASAPALIGAWRSSVQFSGGVLGSVKDLEFLYVFNEGGTMTESSNYDGAPPVAPAYGEWRPTGSPGAFEAKYTFFTTGPPSDVKLLASGGGWLPTGSGVLTERIAVAADGRSFNSRMTLEMFDKIGKPIAGGGEATAHATREGF